MSDITKTTKGNRTVISDGETDVTFTETTPGISHMVVGPSQPLAALRAETQGEAYSSARLGDAPLRSEDAPEVGLSTAAARDISDTLYIEMKAIDGAMWTILHRLTSHAYDDRSAYIADVLRAAELAKSIQSIEAARGALPTITS